MSTPFMKQTGEIIIKRMQKVSFCFTLTFVSLTFAKSQIQRVVFQSHNESNVQTKFECDSISGCQNIACDRNAIPAIQLTNVTF